MMIVFYCLTSLSIIISRSIHVAANSIILFFFMAEQYSIVYMYRIFLIHSYVDGNLVFPCLGYCEQCCNEHKGACIFFKGSFVHIYAYEQDCWVIWQFYIQFSQESPYCFPQWFYQFTFPATVQDGSLLYTPSPAFIC